MNHFKSIFATLTLAAALSGFGCNSTPHATPTSVTSHNEIVETAETPNSHACGATTKAGKPCRRQVANKHGETAKCWQHREKGAQK